MNKAELVKVLQKGLCNVSFEKADGSTRNMLCTLNNNYILVESAGKSKENDKVVVVWDVEKNEWRSFRLDRLISFSQAAIAQ